MLSFLLAKNNILSSIIIIASLDFRAEFRRKEVDDMYYAPREKGQGLVEYALIIAFIAILIIAALGFITGGLNSIFSRIAVYL